MEEIIKIIEERDQEYKKEINCVISPGKNMLLTLIKNADRAKKKFFSNETMQRELPKILKRKKINGSEKNSDLIIQEVKILIKYFNEEINELFYEIKKIKS